MLIMKVGKAPFLQKSMPSIRVQLQFNKIKSVPGAHTTQNLTKSGHEGVLALQSLVINRCAQSDLNLNPTKKFSRQIIQQINYLTLSFLQQHTFCSILLQMSDFNFSRALFDSSEPAGIRDSSSRAVTNSWQSLRSTQSSINHFDIYFFKQVNLHSAGHFASAARIPASYTNKISRAKSRMSSCSGLETPLHRLQRMHSRLFPLVGGISCY